MELELFRVVRKNFPFGFQILVPMERWPIHIKATKNVKLIFLNLNGHCKVPEFFRFLAYCVSTLILVLIMITFIYFEWGTLSLTIVSENMAVARESLDS